VQIVTSGRNATSPGRHQIEPAGEWSNPRDQSDIENAHRLVLET
jgi:hypothetical protein